MNYQRENWKDTECVTFLADLQSTYIAHFWSKILPLVDPPSIWQLQKMHRDCYISHWSCTRAFYTKKLHFYFSNHPSAVIAACKAASCYGMWKCFLSSANKIPTCMTAVLHYKFFDLLLHLHCIFF